MEGDRPVTADSSCASVVTKEGGMKAREEGARGRGKMGKFEGDRGRAPGGRHMALPRHLATIGSI